MENVDLTLGHDFNGGVGSDLAEGRLLSEEVISAAETGTVPEPASLLLLGSGLLALCRRLRK